MLRGYRFGQARIWSEPGGGKIGAEEIEKHMGEDLVNSWREVKDHWYGLKRGKTWECLGSLGYETLVALGQEKGLKAERRLEIGLE